MKTNICSKCREMIESERDPKIEKLAWTIILILAAINALVILGACKYWMQ